MRYPHTHPADHQPARPVLGRARLIRRGFAVATAIAVAATSVLLMIPTGLTAQDAGDGRVCSNATLRGEYGLLASGVRALPPIFGGGTEKFVAVALWAFDGNGGITQQPGSAIHGEVLGSFTDAAVVITGTYDVNANCTGRASLFVPEVPAPIEYAFVIVNNAKEINAAVMSPQPNIVTVSLRRK